MAKTFGVNSWQVGDEVTAQRLNETGDFGSHPDFRELESNVIDLLMQAYFDGKGISYQGLFFDGFSDNSKQSGSNKITFEPNKKRIVMNAADDPLGWDSVTTGSGNTPLTFSHTVPNKANRLLVVFVTAEGGISSITYGGTPLTNLTAYTYDSPFSPDSIGIWYLIAPAVGTANIVVTGPDPTIRAHAHNIVGVDQSSPFGSFVTDTGTIDFNVATVVGDLVLSGVSNVGTWSNATVGAGQTERSDEGSTHPLATSTQIATTTSINQTFGGVTGFTAGAIGVPIHAATLYDGKTGAFYKSILTTFQTAKKSIRLWVTRAFSARFNPVSAVANGATSMKLLAGNRIANGDTIDIYEPNNFVRERKTVSSYTQLIIDLLLVGGGGGGGRNPDDVNSSGGGGGGKVLYVTGLALSGGASIPVTVGAGGVAGVNEDGGIGGTSSFVGQSAVGGNGGGAGGTGGTSGSGQAGGSAGSATGGGGGGDSAPGGNGGNPPAGNGGAGTANSISGSSVNYGGGGGGGAFTAGGRTPGSGGAGGGGSGNGGAGTDGLGGGGGGSGATGPAGDGGDGAVIIRYLTSQMTATGGTITTDGLYTIHTFTSSGTFAITSMSSNLTFTPAIVNAAGFTTSDFVERVDVLPQVSLVNNGAAESFQNPTYVKSLIISGQINQKFLTANGASQVDVAQSKFGGASLLQTHSGDDFVSTPDHPDFDFGGNDFTIDMWVRFNNVAAANHGLISYLTSAFVNRAFVWYVTGGANLTFEYSTNGTTPIAVNRAWSPANNVWYHIAVSRSGANLRMFVDGVQLGATYNIGTDVIFNSPETFNIGGKSAVVEGINGWMDEIRVSNIARYTSNFTPPTSAHVPDANTALLIHANGDDGSTTFIDDFYAGAVEVEDEYSYTNPTSEEDFKAKLNLSRQDTGLIVYAKRLGVALQES